MLLGVVVSRGARLVVGDEIDIALAPEIHVLGLVPRDQGKAEHLEHRFEDTSLQRRKLNKLKAIQPHGVVKKIGHAVPPELRVPAGAAPQGRGGRLL